MSMLNTLKNIPTRLVLMSISVMIIIHLVLLASYTQQHRSTQSLAQRNFAVQQVMNVVHMIQATPSSQLGRAISTLNLPNVNIELAELPRWPLHVNRFTFWRINRLIPRHTNDIQISLHLSNKRWVNVDAKVMPAAMWPQLILLALEILVTMTILFYAWSINRFTQPLKQFQRAAERLGVDMKPMRLEEYRGPHIVRETAQAMNTMQQRIQDLLHDRTILLAAISHDLRTPITRLKLRANHIADLGVRQKTIRDLDEMEEMIAEVLTFASNDYSSAKKVKLDINSLLQTLCDDLADLGYPVRYHGTKKHVQYNGRPLILKRAITNLIQNAIKYGQQADITLTRKANRIHIMVDDQGPGIPPAELEKVFAPFYRCDGSRSRKIAGTGLGLAVARDAIRAHSGDISLTNLQEGGLRVSIIL